MYRQRRPHSFYIAEINKAEIARLKGEKEAFEQSNPPDDADEEELKTWHFAKDLERQIRELKSDNADAIRQVKQLAKAAVKRSATDANRRAFDEAQAALKPVLDQITGIEAELEPYETIKADLAVARAKYRELTVQFVAELKRRCEAMTPPQKQALVMELFAQDLQNGLDASVTEKRQGLLRFVENLWDKYATTMAEIQSKRQEMSAELAGTFQELGYT